MFFFFKQNAASELRISDWSSDVCSSDLIERSCLRATAASKSDAGYLNNPLGNYLCLVQAGQAKQARQQRFSDSRFNVCRVQRIFRDGALDGCLHIQRCPDKLFLFIPVYGRASHLQPDNPEIGARMAVTVEAFG